MAGPVTAGELKRLVHAFILTKGIESFSTTGNSIAYGRSMVNDIGGNPRAAPHVIGQLNHLVDV